MSIKSFIKFVNEGAIAADYKGQKDDDKEATEYKPRSGGEQSFKDAHKVDTKKHPVAPENQFDGGVKQAAKPSAGKGEPVVKQGSSDVKQASGGGQDGTTQGKAGEKSIINPIKK